MHSYVLELPQVAAYFINLERRPDRLKQIVHELQVSQLDATRIAATDGLALDVTQNRGRLSVGETGCLMSHERALRTFLESKAEFALILEDDAKFSNMQSWQAYLSNLAAVMGANNLDLVQLGFIQNSPTSFLGRIYSAMQHKRRASRAKTLNSGEFKFDVMLGDFLAGTHGYLVSRTGATRLIKSLAESVRPADGLIQDLAQQRILKAARLCVSEIAQRSRTDDSLGIDSDVA